MPQVTVYIRKDDLPTWEAVKKKSEFMHNALVPLNSIQGTVEQVREIIDETKVIKNIEKVFNIKPERTLNGVCKIHGTSLTAQGKCLQKGCKYA